MVHIRSPSALRAAGERTLIGGTGGGIIRGGGTTLARLRGAPFWHSARARVGDSGIGVFMVPSGKWVECAPAGTRRSDSTARTRSPPFLDARSVPAISSGKIRAMGPPPPPHPGGPTRVGHPPLPPPPSPARARGPPVRRTRTHRTGGVSPEPSRVRGKGGARAMWGGGTGAGGGMPRTPDGRTR